MCFLATLPPRFRIEHYEDQNGDAPVHRWLLEELRVSLFAQELRTPQPVSIKRLERVWQQLSA